MNGLLLGAIGAMSLAAAGVAAPAIAEARYGATAGQNGATAQVQVANPQGDQLRTQTREREHAQTAVQDKQHDCDQTQDRQRLHQS